MKGLNDGMDRSDKLALATNLRGLRENIYDAVNTQVDGEFLFSGSDSTQRALQKNDEFELNGRIDYGGDGFLRKIAVQPGTYRDRGVTAYDVTHYTSNRATKDANTGNLFNDFNFEDRERIIDENGYEWKVVVVGTNLVRDPSDPSQNAADEIFDTSVEPPEYKAGTLALQQYNHQGEMLDPSAYPESRITIDTVVYETEADTYDREGATREQYTILHNNGDIVDQPDSRVFEAKHSYFDDINKVINALEGHITKLDGTKGSEIGTTFEDETFLDDLLRDGLDQTSMQYDASNVGHGELGGRNKVFEGALEKLAAQETHYNILIQETDGADMAKLAMETKSLEMTYQALYTTISKMNQLSLLNYIK
jgi:flagellar hook-associated protein 3 FlgL